MGFSYLEHGTDPLLRQIAGEIVTYQASEIGVMNDHLAQWNQQGTEGSTAMGWMGMRVPRDQMTGHGHDEADAGARRRTRPRPRRAVHAADDPAPRGRHPHGAVRGRRTRAPRRCVRGPRAMIDGQKGEIAELNRWRVHARPAAVKLTLISLRRAAAQSVGYGRMRGLAASRLGTITLRLK